MLHDIHDIPPEPTISDIWDAFSFLAESLCKESETDFADMLLLKCSTAQDGRIPDAIKKLEEKQRDRCILLSRMEYIAESSAYLADEKDCSSLYPLVKDLSCLVRQFRDKWAEYEQTVNESLLRVIGPDE